MKIHEWAKDKRCTKTCWRIIFFLSNVGVFWIWNLWLNDVTRVRSFQLISMSFPLTARQWKHERKKKKIILELLSKVIFCLFISKHTLDPSRAPVAAFTSWFPGLIRKFKDAVVLRSRATLMIYEWISRTLLTVLYLSNSGLLFDGVRWDGSRIT